MDRCLTNLEETVLAKHFSPTRPMCQTKFDRLVTVPLYVKWKLQKWASTSSRPVWSKIQINKTFFILYILLFLIKVQSRLLDHNVLMVDLPYKKFKMFVYVTLISWKFINKIGKYDCKVYVKSMRSDEFSNQFFRCNWTVLYFTTPKHIYFSSIQWASKKKCKHFWKQNIKVRF